MEGPPLSEFSSLVAPDLFDRYPDSPDPIAEPAGNMEKKFRLVSSTPFGSPVVPEV